MSWEAESAPSSEQERMQEDQELDHMLPPHLGLWSWETQTPPQPKAKFPELPAFLSKAPS